MGSTGQRAEGPRQELGRRPRPGTVWCSAHWVPARRPGFPSLSGVRRSSPDDQGPANAASTSTAASHRPFRRREARGAVSRQHLLGVLSICYYRRREKHLTQSLLQRYFFYYYLEWVLKYSDLWLVVEFIKVIFPDAVVLRRLTH